VTCQGFDCEDNEKWQVWADYGGKIVNDRLMERIDKDNRKLIRVEVKMNLWSIL